MKKYLHVPLFLFVLFTIGSCNKNGVIEYEFIGRVVSTLNGNGVSDALVKFRQQKINDGLVGGPFTDAGSTQTDSNGDFSLSFPREKAAFFEVEVLKENYFEPKIEISSADVTTGTPNFLTLAVAPISTIKFDITNTSPSESDHLKIILQDFREDCQQCAENRTYEYFGPLDSTITYQTTGGTYAQIVWINVSGGTSVIDSIYAEPFQTIVYPINY